MNYAAFIDRVTESSGLAETQVRRVLKAAGLELGVAMREGESVRIPGVGTFRQSWAAPRVVRAIHNRRRRMLDGHYRMKFRPAAAVRAAIRDRTPAVFTREEHQRAWRLADTLLADLEDYGALRTLTLGASDSDERVREALRVAAGADWTAVVATYERDVTESVRAECDHLALAARQRHA